MNVCWQCSHFEIKGVRKPRLTCGFAKNERFDPQHGIVVDECEKFEMDVILKGSEA